MAPKRRDKGSGSAPLQRKSDGLWRCQWTDSTGRRHDVYATTRKAVVAKRDAAILRAAVEADPSQMTAGAFFTDWIHDTKRKQLAPRSFEKYDGLVRNQIIPAIGALRLSDITAERLNALYNKQLVAGGAPNSVRYLHAVLRNGFAEAARRRLIASNPADGLRPPKRTRNPMHPLDQHQAQALLRTARGHPLEALFLLALKTGMRQGELLGLRWSDVDLAHRRIHIQTTLQRIEGRLVLTEPKTSRSRRTIELSPATAAALVDHRAHQKAMLAAHGIKVAADSLIFTNEAAEPVSGRHVTQRFLPPLLRDAGLPPIRFHDLRHTAATLMLRGGIHPKVVQEMLGHTSITMTLDTYSHVIPAMQSEAVTKLDELLGIPA